ncbi:zinc finger protein 501-like [Agrilus planipennis]|uniref:Zinc finger protein 501-like n=1 Tax=Agrilus planipennis TaxID=224129 RepID=A0A1W4WDE2_AGRPL|nr:zinc finger protein 501-like [Agrilus planipennis]
MSNTKNESFQSAFVKAVEVMDPSATKRIRIECETCKRIFTQNSHFNSHLCNQKPRRLACEICHKMFSSKSRLEQHWRVHSGEKPFECHICKKRFPHKNYMTKHLLIHSDDKPFKCNVCDKSYVQADTLKEHMYVHTGEKPHKCEHCGKEFRVMSNLRMHLNTHENSKAYECILCPKVCSSSNNLKAHMAIHENEKPFKCETCDKCFALKSTLDRHTNTHLEERPFKCDHCAKAFTRKDCLSVHIKYTHENQSINFEKCHVCNKRFMFKSRLEKHMKVHSQLGCLLCGRSTEECVCSKYTTGYDQPKKNPLTRDNFLIKCQTCFRIILRKSQLKVHLRVHRDYKCIVCNEDFRNCSCSENDMAVSKSKNTYRKSSKSLTNVNEGLTNESGVNVKKEETVNEPVIKYETSDESREIIIQKEEPKQEYFKIEENFVEIAAEVDEDSKAFRVKEEITEF